MELGCKGKFREKKSRTVVPERTKYRSSCGAEIRCGTTNLKQGIVSNSPVII
jgi:hypothetical protein